MVSEKRRNSVRCLRQAHEDSRVIGNEKFENFEKHDNFTILYRRRHIVKLTNSRHDKFLLLSFFFF